jgi:hypothetical protein
MKPTLRIAENADGKAIGELAWSAGFTVEGVNWEDIYPYWLVAELHGGIVGAIQVLPGKPVGRLEMLCVDKSLRKRDRGKVVMALLYQALAVLELHGAKFASGFIPTEMQSYVRVISKRGAWTCGFGELALARI